MKKYILLALSLMFSSMVSANAQAGEFAWLEDLAVQARLDEAGLRTRIAARFNIGDARLSAVIGDVGGRHEHAYMVLRMAEMSHQPVDTVIRHYHTYKNRGWGVMAKQLGIKPGSRDFHALKRGHDLGYSNHHGSPGKGKGKQDKAWKEKGNGKGKGKGKDK